MLPQAHSNVSVGPGDFFTDHLTIFDGQMCEVVTDELFALLDFQSFQQPEFHMACLIFYHDM